MGAGTRCVAVTLSVTLPKSLWWNRTRRIVMSQSKRRSDEEEESLYVRGACVAMVHRIVHALPAAPPPAA
jgi:hypothetical protein